MGVALIPDIIAQNYMPKMAIVSIKLDEPWAARQLNICVRDMETLSGAATLLVQHLSKQQ